MADRKDQMALLSKFEKHYKFKYNQNNKLTWSSNALKQNLVTYLSQYRMINDTININFKIWSLLL